MAKVGFGHSVNTKRFTYTALHPQLIRESRNPLAPGQYHPKLPKCNRKIQTSCWKRKQETEEFSKFLGFRNQRILDDRKFWKTMGGPGSYDVVHYAPAQTGASVLQDVGFGREERFQTFFKDINPPPGTHTLKTARTKFNTRPTFEWDGFVSRFKSTEEPYWKAPNRYKLPVVSILNHVVTKRGPYDCFTGPRDGTTIKNYFAPPAFKPPERYLSAMSDLDYLLHNPAKQRCGKFLLEERFPENATVKVARNGCSFTYRYQDMPGPDRYDLKGAQAIKAAKPNKHPFNNSKVHARPPPPWKIHPGPERYKVKWPRCHMKEVRKSWMFKSKGTRDIYTVENYAAF